MDLEYKNRGSTLSKVWLRCFNHWDVIVFQEFLGKSIGVCGGQHQYKKATTKNGEHPTHQGPALPRNTLLTVDLPYSGTPFSRWTCPTAEHPNHCGSAPLQNTLLIVDLLHRGKPYSCGPAPPWNTRLNLDLYYRGTPYSEWTCTIAKHPTHSTKDTIANPS